MRCLKRIKFSQEHTGQEREEAEMTEKTVKEDVEVGEGGAVDPQCQVQVDLYHQCLACRRMFLEISGHHRSQGWKDFSHLPDWGSFLQDFLLILLQAFLRECFLPAPSQVI